MANRKPPLPSFQDKIKVPGYAMSVYKIGEISIKVAAIVELMPNTTYPWVPSEDTILSFDKFYIFSATPAG
jgi:hypothetical protein